MKKSFLILVLSITTFITGCGCGNSEPTNAVVDETETQVIEAETELVTETEEIIDTEVNESTGVEIVEVLDVTMYVVSAATIREGDGTNFKMINTLMKGGTAHVTGKTANGWYEIDCGTVKGYVPADSLSLEDPNPSKEFTEEEQKQSDENNDIFEQMKQQFDEEAIQESPTEMFDSEGNPDLPKDQSKVDFGAH